MCYWKYAAEVGGLNPFEFQDILATCKFLLGHFHDFAEFETQPLILPGSVILILHNFSANQYVLMEQEIHKIKRLA